MAAPHRGAMVAVRMAALRREYPGCDNWIGLTIPGHEAGECIECDALRALEAEANRAEGSA